MSVSRRSISQPGESARADATRVAAIRNGLDLSDGLAPAFFGERARLEVVASAERLLAAVRSADVIQSGDRLREAVELIARQDPSRLTPRGVTRLFVGRRRRLTRVRRAFESASLALDQVARDLDDRAGRLARRVDQLDRLHAQARGFILDLDAYREAGASIAAPAADPAWTRFPGRVETLEAARRSAIELLALVRTIQNIDAPLGAALTSAAAAVRAWREDWSDQLGLSPRLRGRRMRPDPVGLYETKAQALDRLTAPTLVVAEARKRRQQTESRMALVVEALAAPRARGRGPVGETVSDA